MNLLDVYNILRDKVRDDCDEDHKRSISSESHCSTEERKMIRLHIKNWKLVCVFSSVEDLEGVIILTLTCLAKTT